MFLGHHFDRTEVEFRSVSAGLQGLNVWIDRSGTEQQESYGATPGEAIYRLTFTPLPREYAEFSRGRVVLGHNWRRMGNSLDGMTLRERLAIGIEYNENQDFRIIPADIGRLQGLVGMCLDTPATVERLVLKRPDVTHTTFSGTDTGAAKEVEFRTPLL